MTTTYPIVPLPLPPHRDPRHPIPRRREISKLANDAANPENLEAQIYLSLFLRALRRFMEMDDLDCELSYFRIAAIHGAPYVEWDGVTSPGRGYEGSNFCAHNKIEFSTWHRPYLLLFERRLYDIMEDVIADVPNDQQPLWRLVRERWRLPFWDWGWRQSHTDLYGLPEIATKQFVDPLDRNHINPLWKFTNPKKDENGKPLPMGHPAMGRYAISDKIQFECDWWLCTATSRHVKLDDAAAFAAGENNYESVDKEFNNPDWYPPKKGDSSPSGLIGDMVHRLMSNKYETFDEFSSTTYYQEHPNLNFLSLEYIHNNIHNFTGGPSASGFSGHMEDISVASFDPIFWLHHSYIDQLLAQWQLLTGDELWFDGSKPLDPFHKDTAGTSFTSNDVRNITKLNYDYDYDPVPPPDPSKDAEAVVEDPLADLKRSINRKYGLTRYLVLGSSDDFHGKKNDYVVNIIYDRYALDKSYTIYFFIDTNNTLTDDIPPSQFTKLKSYVGCVATFSSRSGDGPGQTPCANCAEQKAKGVLSRAQVPLTVALLRHAQDTQIHAINSLKPDEVENYLASKLVWKVVEVGGEVVPLKDDRLKSLKVFTMKGIAEHSPDDAVLSTFYGYKPMYGPTEGKDRGASEEDDRYLGAPQDKY